MQIDGGSNFTQRKCEYKDLVEELLEQSRDERRELSREEALIKLESELKLIKDSKSSTGDSLKNLKASLISGTDD